MIGEIEKIETLFEAQNGQPYWHLVKLKDTAEEFGLHMNWQAFFGDLKPGDKVEYTVSKCKLGLDGTQGINKKGYLLFEKLRRIKEKKALEEEMLNLVKKET